MAKLLVELWRGFLRKRRRLAGCLGLLSLLALAFAVWLGLESRPMPKGEALLVRFPRAVRLHDAFVKLHKLGVVRDARAASTLAWMWRDDGLVGASTVRVRPGMSVKQVLRAIRNPLLQHVRIPEGWWIARTAKILERKNVCPAEDYIRAAANPARFANVTKLKLPKNSLEGYLFPDTYDFPPLLGADEVIRRQLKTFEKRVGPFIRPGVDLRRVLTVASMVELEAAVDPERPRIAGVIENRLRRGMKLQIDATVLYGLQEWRELAIRELTSVKSPYNTYLIPGLPPGPIGSPGLASIKGALEPEKHDFLYYVARPNRTHFFSTTYAGHEAAILRARKERQAAREAGG